MTISALRFVSMTLPNRIIGVHQETSIIAPIIVAGTIGAHRIAIVAAQILVVSSPKKHDRIRAFQART